MRESPFARRGGLGNGGSRKEERGRKTVSSATSGDRLNWHPRGLPRQAMGPEIIRMNHRRYGGCSLFVRLVVKVGKPDETSLSGTMGPVRTSPRQQPAPHRMLNLVSSDDVLFPVLSALSDESGQRDALGRHVSFPIKMTRYAQLGQPSAWKRLPKHHNPSEHAHPTSEKVSRLSAGLNRPIHTA